MKGKYDRVKDLAQGMELCIYEYLGKAAEDDDFETVQEALCCLGARIITGWRNYPAHEN